jgi:hypothetical protein
MTIPRILALGLGELVDLTTNEPHQELLGKGMRDRLALVALMVFEQLHALEGGGAGDQLVTEAGLVLLREGVVVDLGVRFAGFVWEFVSLWEYEVGGVELPNPNILTVVLFDLRSGKGTVDW